jgi:4-aminobutyrate aminotransferase/diaminobutyrate-pyruvate transaminase/4-aminobutyrate aminotransferase/(S)-3-amino-2-methylpropionate transaminase
MASGPRTSPSTTSKNSSPKRASTRPTSPASCSPAYLQALRKWCDKHQALLVCDEVQAGFGRTGKFFGFEHYGILPDLTTFGKGISSSLPLSAIAGRPELMDLHPAGSMTSTHTGNPVCCAAALASIDLITKENLTENARLMGDLLHQRLNELKAKYPQIGAVLGKGLVAGVICIQPGTKTPDGDLAFDVVCRCMEKGVLMFSPVGVNGSTVKIAPPLVITAEAIEESCAVLAEAFAEVTAARS